MTYRIGVHGPDMIIVLGKTSRSGKVDTADGHIEFTGKFDPVRPSLDVRVGVICHHSSEYGLFIPLKALLRVCESVGLCDKVLKT